MDEAVNLDTENINVACSILEKTNSDSLKETLTVYPDLDTLITIAESSNSVVSPPFIHSLCRNETEDIYPDLYSDTITSPTNSSIEGSGSRKDGKFKCQMCPCTFDNELKYQVHLIKHQQTEYIECNVCGKNIVPNRFAYHVMIHTGEKPHVCSICNRGFRLGRDLRQHFFTHTGERPYPCNMCGKNFADTSSRRKHLQTHTGEKPYSCSICKRAFTQLSHLREHQVTHTKQKDHTCELCYKQFTTKSSMQRHILTHTNTCPVCNQTFTTNKKLQKHKELHNAERPFSCPICFRRFLTSADIKTHMLIHSEEKNVICNICNGAFKSQRYLRVHYTSSHKELGPPHQCKICHKGFFQDKSMKRHFLAHFSESNKREKCPECGISFPCNDSLGNHLKENGCNNLGCFECNSKFNNKEDLMTHARMFHNLFSDSSSLGDEKDTCDKTVVKDPPTTSQKPVYTDFTKQNTEFLTSFADLSSNCSDDCSEPPIRSKKKLKKSSSKDKSKNKGSSSQSCENKMLPTIVKVDSNSVINISDSDSNCEYDKDLESDS